MNNAGKVEIKKLFYMQNNEKKKKSKIINDGGKKKEKRKTCRVKMGIASLSKRK